MAFGVHTSYTSSHSMGEEMHSDESKLRGRANMSIAERDDNGKKKLFSNTDKIIM